MTLKLATIWENIAIYVNANGEAFSLTKHGLKLKKTNTTALGWQNKKYLSRSYADIQIGTIHSDRVRRIKHFWLHALVCTAFHGPRPSPRHQVDHINRNRWDNRPENLRWVTRRENYMNSITHIRKLERERLALSGLA